MELSNQTPFAVLPLPGRMGYPKHSVTMIVKGTFELVKDGTARLAAKQLPIVGDVFYPDDEEGTGSVWYDSDLAHFKPAADAVLVGKCHAPNGGAVSSCLASFQVGSRARAVRVNGERVWSKGLVSTKASEPKLFREMDLRYERSFGGPGFAANPVGKGIKILEVQGHRVQLLPNIEDPKALVDSPKSRPAPAGFGPLARSWQSRTQRMGTYGKRWLQTRSPWFPEDMDWSTFNCAPPEMRFPDYLRGDEEIVLGNLHPQHGEYRSRLPGTRVRCFLRPRSDQGVPILREIDMKLDTLWINAEEEMLVLVWRGHGEVQSNELEDVDQVFVVSEPVDGAPAPLGEWKAKFGAAVETPPLEGESKANAEPTGEAPVNDVEEEPEEPEDPEPADPDLGEPAQIQLGPEERKLQARIMKAFGHTDEELLQAGIAREDIPPDTPQERELQDKIRKELGIEAPPEEEEEAPPDAQPAGWTRESVIEHARAGGTFRSESLDGLDLSELSLSGLDFSGASLRGANLSGSSFDGCDLSGADLRRADLTGASLSEAKLSGANLGDAALAKANLEKADLSGATASRARFDEANLESARAAGMFLEGSSFRFARLEGADLQETNLRNCLLDGATLRGTDLRKADLTGATAGASARFEGADLSEALIGPGASFPRCIFRQVTAAGSIWSGVDLEESDFSHASLEGASFAKSRLERASLHGADAKRSVFYKTNLRHARLTRMNLFHGILQYANLMEADLSGSNLYGADLSDAIRDRTRFDGTNLRKTALEG